MTGRPIKSRLAAAVGLRPGEGPAAALFFLYFFLVTAPFTIVKSVRDASYLDELGAENLPWAYATTILIAGAVAVHARLQARLPRRRLLLGSLAVFAVTAIGFIPLLAAGRPAALLAYWLWANVLIVVLTTQFWFLVNDAFDPREAKRLIGFLGSGGILGGVAGGLLAGALGQAERPERLLVPAALLLAGAAAAAGALFRVLSRTRLAAGRPGGSTKAGFRDSFDTVRRDRYLRLIAVLAVLAGIVSTFIDWQSKTVIARTLIRPGAPANLGAFFGRFNAGILVLAFIFQLILTSRFLGRFGLKAGLMVYPAALLLGVSGVGAWPVLGWAMAIKGGDKALSYSVHQSVRELLFIPVAAARKYRAKVFIDVFLNRLAKAVGGGLLLLLFLVPAAPDLRLKIVSAAAAVFLALWIGLNVKLGRAYGRTVREHLEKKWDRGEGVVGTADAGAAKMLLDALQSRERSPSLYLMHLYDLAREGRMTPEVLRLLSAEPSGTPSNPLLDGDIAPLRPGGERDLPEADAEIREIMALPEYQQVMKEYAGRLLRGEAPGGETAKMELAKSAGFMDPRAPVAALIDDLLLEDSPEIVHYAAEAAGRLKRREAVALLAARLADPRTRADAREALVRFGPSIAGTLGDYLLDPRESEAVRSEIALLLAESPSRDTAEALLDALAGGPPGADAEIIESLDRLRAAKPALPFDAAVVREAVERQVKRSGDWRTKAEALPVFKLIGFLYPKEDLERPAQNFIGGTKTEEAFALEFLDQLLPLDLKPKIIAALERVAGRPAEGSR